MKKISSTFCDVMNNNMEKSVDNIEEKLNSALLERQEPASKELLDKALELGDGGL